LVPLLPIFLTEPEICLHGKAKEYSSHMHGGYMSNWFTIYRIDDNTDIISEYRHWEEIHCYLLNGTASSLLIDTGLGICNIHNEVMSLTNKPVIATVTNNLSCRDMLPNKVTLSRPSAPGCGDIRTAFCPQSGRQSLSVSSC
jgi:hypothetical protein